MSPEQQNATGYGEPLRGARTVFPSQENEVILTFTLTQQQLGPNPFRIPHPRSPRRLDTVEGERQCGEDNCRTTIAESQFSIHTHCALQ